MNIDLSPLRSVGKLLLNVELKPVQGARFQPTGFPDLGAATYQAGDTPCLLVESAQSMANRLEATCWDDAKNELHAPLMGLSYIRVEQEGRYLTSSITDAHRINSAYIEYSNNGEFHKQLASEIGYSDKKPIDRSKFTMALMKFDINSLLHGVFLESIGGRLRVARAVSAFIEAQNVNVAASGGVKTDHIQPGSEKGSQQTAKEGFGNVPFHREEYTAEKIIAYFNLDLAQIRGYGLGEEAERLLILLALYKIRILLDGDLRLRTACDLTPANGDGVMATTPRGFTLPSLAELEKDLPAAISACKNEMAGVTTVAYQPEAKTAKKDKKSMAETPDNDSATNESNDEE